MQKTLQNAVLFLAILFSGCQKDKEDEIFGEWVYKNQSSHQLEISGTGYEFSNGEISFVLAPNEQHQLPFFHQDLKQVSAKNNSCPHAEIFWNSCKIIISNRDTVFIQPEEYIRKRENYKAQCLSDTHLQFTYIFTDQEIETLLRTKE